MAKLKSLEGENLLLFHETKNIFYSFLRDLSWYITMDTPDKEISKAEIIEKAEENISQESKLLDNTYRDFIEELLKLADAVSFAVKNSKATSDMNVSSEKGANEINDALSQQKKANFFSRELNKNDNTDIIYKLSIDEEAPVPFLLNIYEKRALKTLLQDNRFRNLASQNLLEFLDEQFSEIHPYEWNDFLMFRGNTEYDELADKKVQKNIKIIMSAILNRNSIKCINTKAVDYQNEEQIIYPYKLMYSPVTGKVQLLATKKDINRIILLNVIALENVSEDHSHNLSDDEFADLLEAQKESEPIIIEIKNFDTKGKKTNAVERFFMMFSNQNKKATYDEVTYTYKVELYYYKFDEYDIINKLLQLGPSVTVISPDKIIDKLIEKVSKAYKNY